MKKTEPVYLRELWSLCGRNALNVAGYMKCSPSTINRVLNDNEATERLELRAQEAIKLIEEETLARQQASQAPAQLLVSVPPMKIEAFQRVASAMGLEVTAL